MPFVGQLNAKVDCYINNGIGVNNNQNFYKCLWDFLISHPRMTEVAANRGAGSSGTGYHDQTGPFGTNAWSVFKWSGNGSSLRNGTGGYANYDRYIMIQWSNEYNFGGNDVGQAQGFPAMSGGYGDTGTGAGNGNTATFNNVSISVAIAPATTTTNISNNPINTLTGAYVAPGAAPGAGSAQTKNSNPVWTQPNSPSLGTDLFIFPRNNSGNPTGGVAGGYHSTNPGRHNMCTLLKRHINLTVPTRVHFFADDDSMLIAWSVSDDGNYNLWYHGLYTPKTGLSVPWPEVCLSISALSTWIPCDSNSDLGSESNLAYDNQNGGIVAQVASGGIGVRNYRIDRINKIMETANFVNHPNRITSSLYDEFPISMYVHEAPTFYGFAGIIDWFREIQGAPTHHTSSDINKIIVGNSSRTSKKVVIPWSGSQPTLGTASVTTPWYAAANPPGVVDPAGTTPPATVDVGLQIPVGGVVPGMTTNRGGITFRRAAGTW